MIRNLFRNFLSWAHLKLSRPKPVQAIPAENAKIESVRFHRHGTRPRTLKLLRRVRVWNGATSGRY